MNDTNDERLRALVIDDERNLRESLVSYLKTENIDALGAQSGEAARELLETERVDAVVVDLRMPGMSGLDFLSWLRDGGPAVPAIMISAHGDVADAVEAMKRGAADYLTKPFSPDELVVRLRKAIGDSRMAAAAGAAKRATGGESIRGDAGEAWIGSGAAMVELRRLAERVAPTNSTVLVTGESGTGKEVVARLLHRMSKRSDGPFIPINLGGIPENLLESELFGYERGAFTGAESRKIGLFELAAGGTLFLDEVGDMPLQLQVKMLRVLQEKRTMRLGGTRGLPIDARIVAATNRDLEESVRKGTFREDLFYRLNVIRLRLPPLRERPEDIPALASRFASRFASEMGKSTRGLDPEALKLLASYPFPGNVRELENAVERAVILCDGEYLCARDFSFAGAEMNPLALAAGRSGFHATEDGPLLLRDLEKQAIEAALARHDGHREKTSAELGITRRTLLNKMNEYEIR
ncbi:MAG: sigma-54 dependent transcriptional regulator [Treponemataceae bacterium]